MTEYNRVVIPIGPQHPSLKEPACFTVTLEGEKIVDAVIGSAITIGESRRPAKKYYTQIIYLPGTGLRHLFPHAHYRFLPGRGELPGWKFPAGGLYPRPGCRDRTAAQPPALAWRGRPTDRLRYHVHVYLARREAVLDILWQAATASIIPSTPLAACAGTSTTPSSRIS